MPLYEFVDEEGNHEERVLSADEAPRLGEKVVLDGKLLTRAVRAPRTAVKADRHFVAWSQPTMDTLRPGEPRFKRYDTNPNSPSYGHGLVQGRKEIDEYVAKSEGRITYGE